VNQVPTPAGAPAISDAVPPVEPLPVQRAREGTPAEPSRTAAVVLLADPRPASRAALSVSLRGGGMIDVREAASVAEVDAVIARGVAGGSGPGQLGVRAGGGSVDRRAASRGMAAGAGH